MHVIIGAGGAIGTPLAAELIQKQQKVRLLSRSGATMEGAEALQVDVFDRKALTEAIRGASVAYLLIGLEYKTAVWQAKWPLLMQHVIDACSETQVPLIFFDNVYMYGLVEGKMTEETPFNPCSKKGEVRAKVATQLLEAVGRGDVRAAIARSADFYGPHASTTSVFYQVILQNLVAGKKAQWLGNPNMPHSMSYTLDCARALALLAERPEAMNQTWHMPTFNPPPLPTELAALSARLLDIPFKGVQAAPKWLVNVMGLFMPIMKELGEMMYQNDYPYWFDSNKFEQAFSFKPTDYETGIQQTIAFFQLKK